MRVVIVGAGLAGLATAVDLADGGLGGGNFRSSPICRW